MAIVAQNESFAAEIRAIKAGLMEFRKTVQTKVLRRAMSKGLTIVRKGVRKRIPAKYKDARRSIGSSLSKNLREAITIGRVGTGVGMKRKRQDSVNQSLKKSRFKRKDKKKQKIRGVGISPNNIHWFILGTKGRTHKGGKSTGAMDPVFPDVVVGGLRDTQSAAMKAITTEARRLTLIEGYRLREKQAAKIAAKP